MAKFEGAAAADKFARRQSTYSSAVRQSIPDIRFDEHGVPISTRQLTSRSRSGSGSHNDAVNCSSLEKQNVRRLSKSFSSDGEDDNAVGGVKTNFTVPTSTRAGMLGSNRRWSIRPDWMTSTKRRLSVKEEFIEKNLKNVEIPPPRTPSLSRRSSSEETDRDVPDLEHQYLEDIADESEESESESSAESDSSHSNETGSESSNFASCLSSEPEEEKIDIDTVAKGDDEIFLEAVETVSEIAELEVEKESEEVAPLDRRQSQSNRRQSTKAERRESKSERRHSKSDRRLSNSERRKSNLERRKSKDRRRSSVKDDVMPPRPPPPPLLVQMCNVSDYWDSSSSDEENTIVTKYGKQKIYVSDFHHEFELCNGTEVSTSFQLL